MDAKLLPSITAVEPARWDALVPGGDPFVSHAFLSLLETSGSATTRTGWQPLHLLVEDEGRSVAAAAMYAKGHSWGEYVFDHAWAEAYERAGGRYYPKLQVAVPFTPVPGPRLLSNGAGDGASASLIAALAATAEQTGVSSLHVTFCTADEAERLARAGFLVRRGIQFHWTNQGYRDFQDFLDNLKSSRRKTIRKEREAVRASGIEIEVQHGATLDPAALRAFHPLYRATADKRWGSAYLTRAFFEGLAGMAERVVLVLARRNGKLVAGALNLLGEGVLYGRNWGVIEEHPFLHFECCYYAAIEWAIAHGIARVEAGAQGTHKLHRGYAPVWTWSAHLLRDSGFREAVARFLHQEQRRQAEDLAAYRTALPYRRTEEEMTAG